MAPPEPLAELNRSIRLLRQATAASWLVPPFMLVVPIVCFMNALAALGRTDRSSEVPMTVVLFATYLLPGLFAARCAFAGARAKRLLRDAPPDTVRHSPCPADAADAFRIFTAVSTVQAIIFPAPVVAPLVMAVYAMTPFAGIARISDSVSFGCSLAALFTIQTVGLACASLNSIASGMLPRPGDGPPPPAPEPRRSADEADAGTGARLEHCDPHAEAP